MFADVVRRRQVEFDGVRVVGCYPRLAGGQDIQLIRLDEVSDQSTFVDGAATIERADVDRARV